MADVTLSVCKDVENGKNLDLTTGAPTHCGVRRAGSWHSMRVREDRVSEMRGMEMSGLMGPLQRRMFSVAVLLLLLSFGARSAGALTDDVPSAIPQLIQTTWAAARKDWTMEAVFCHLLIERDAADQPFRTDAAFLAASTQQRYHVKTGPKGRMADLEAYKFFGPGLAAKVIDLPRAVAIARQHGMKGNLVTAELADWAPSGTNMAVQVWRLVPDDDPNVADPNDPNMKNYLIDALTGAIYDPDHADMPELQRGAYAKSTAVTAELMAFLQSMKHQQ